MHSTADGVPACADPRDKWLREIVGLVHWDKDGATGPVRQGMSWESIGRLALDYAKAAIEDAGADGVPLAAPTVTDEQLTASFTKAHSGPNPFYACVHCGASVPGLREYLVSHFNTHGVTSLVGVGTDQIEQPTATHGASHLYGVRASDAAVPVQPQPEGGNGN